MGKIIRKRQIVEDDWTLFADDAEIPADSQPIVTLARYKKEGGQLIERFAKLGVRVPSDKLPQDIPNIDKLALIAIEFPKFSDGRGYTVGRMLRDRHNSTGELRAVGWVIREWMSYMERCGFDAWELKPGKPLESALQAFGEITHSYQSTPVQKLPIYRRR